jgi:CheY-like chemotaxis protein
LVWLNLNLWLELHLPKSRNFIHLARIILQKTFMRVLIADDQKNVGTALAAMVAKCHHEVVEVVTSGFEAIQAYNRHQPDLVLIDYYMPHLNGATACRNILSRHPTANVVLVSGVAGTDDLAHFGAIGRLSKPVDLLRLKELLDSVSVHDEGAADAFAEHDALALVQPTA